ncbi:GrpB family protein [Pseudomonas sp. TUM22785]|uniref:GrpB family protein n=1 Tax=Pseudomonas sp. TUM22785 TaxID=3019098 RepID=UPI00230613B3|nr:GrpB family protein [Pseudomonas sp. TUM22785]WCD79776.1 GrpB family protein [Pseudomonas sp. TUM22785]
MTPQTDEPTFDGTRWSNADSDRIEVVDPNPEWPQRYREEAAAISDALGIRGLRLEHYGSTSVPGLAAKPIIDILLLPPPDYDWQRLVAPLEALGYQFWRDNPATDRMFFVKGMPPKGTGRTHHVHVMTQANAVRHLLFRDHLRAHPEDAAEYARVKRQLAERHPTDRDAYTAGKDEVVGAILGRATAAMHEAGGIQGGDEGGPVKG